MYVLMTQADYQGKCILLFTGESAGWQVKRLGKPPG